MVAATLNSGGNDGGFRSEPGEHLVAHTLRAEGHDASEDGTGRGTPLVAVAMAFSSKDHGADAAVDVSPTLRSMNFDKSHVNGGGQVAIAFTERTRSDGPSLECQSDVAYTLMNPGDGGRPKDRMLCDTQKRVRRLTPVECERIQGFPDNWTAGFADSTRYRMLGNAIAVPVAEWIGRRIVMSFSRKGH